MGQDDRRPGKGRAQETGFEDAPPRRTGQIPAQRAGPIPGKQGGARPTRSTRTATGQVPSQGPQPSSTTGSFQPHGTPAASSPPVSGPMAMTNYQKQQLGSAFGDAKQDRKRSNFFGTESGRKLTEEESTEPVAKPVHFDGQTAPPELALRDLWKAVPAPVQSREGRRSAKVYEQALKQFAIATNPRYAEDAPGKPRAHIFIWDVSRAMACEIPHFVGAKELNLAQTCDWVRHEGPMRGWLRTGEMEAFELANAGQMVLAMPRDPRTKGLALVFPQPMNDDGVPLLAGAGKQRGWGLSALELFGHKQTEYFTHV